MNSDRVFFVTTVTIQGIPIFRREATARLPVETLAHYREQEKFLPHEFSVFVGSGSFAHGGRPGAKAPFI